MSEATEYEPVPVAAAREVCERYRKDYAEHRARHQELHQMLDELAADWIQSTGGLPSEVTLFELMEWSHRQTQEAGDESF